MEKNSLKKAVRQSHKPARNSLKPEGFISIIALGIFALLMIFAISLQMTIVDTFANLRNSQNYDQAQDIAKSMIGYLQWKIKSHEAGWNTGKVICGFGKYAGETTNEGGGITGFCQDPGLLALAKPLQGQAQKDIEMILEVKGRSTDKIKTAVCGKFAGSCYVTPTPGTGDAGKNCNMYTPDYAISATVDSTLANGSINLDQTNYSCNWNKLTLGSSQTDRVAVPLYYDNATLSGATDIKSPFMNPNPAAKNLLVRMRTPCKPCAASGVAVDGTNSDYLRACNDQVKDETVCADKDRYVLDATTSDDIIAQWLINGECDTGGGKMESCGITPSPKLADNSALFESRILANNKNIFLNSYQVIGNETLAYDVNNYSTKNPDPIAILTSLKYPVKLPSISKPVLTLFLNHPLWTVGKHNIPYLEYQVLTDQPISNNQASLEATITVDGNSFKKTLTKQVAKPLIDFAIHN